MAKERARGPRWWREVRIGGDWSKSVTAALEAGGDELGADPGGDELSTDPGGSELGVEAGDDGLGTDPSGSELGPEAGGPATLAWTPLRLTWHGRRNS